jgi:hypothetical protein
VHALKKVFHPQQANRANQRKHTAQYQQYGHDHFPPIAMVGAALIVAAVIVSEMKTKGQKALELRDEREQEQQG